MPNQLRMNLNICNIMEYLNIMNAEVTKQIILVFVKTFKSQIIVKIASSTFRPGPQDVFWNISRISLLHETVPVDEDFLELNTKFLSLVQILSLGPTQDHPSNFYPGEYLIYRQVPYSPKNFPSQNICTSLKK